MTVVSFSTLKKCIQLIISILDRERDKATLAYVVGQDYEKYWTHAKSTHHACILPAFDTNDSPINPDHFVNKLVGALCKVTFTLKHYAIGAQKSSKEGESYVEAHDIFSAQVETVAVLKNPPSIVRSPYKGVERTNNQMMASDSDKRRTSECCSSLYI